MNPSEALAELQAREAIRDCLYRYCRGIDRCDEAALRAAYWPDATDRHGPYSGSASGFIDWAITKLKDSERSVHAVSNISIDLHGAMANVESYFQALQRDRDASGLQREVFLAGRYVDRFECRDGEWRISARTVVYDWMRELGSPEGSEAGRFGIRQPQGSKKPNDPFYTLFGEDFV